MRIRMLPGPSAYSANEGRVGPSREGQSNVTACVACAAWGSDRVRTSASLYILLAWATMGHAAAGQAETGALTDTGSGRHPS